MDQHLEQIPMAMVYRLVDYMQVLARHVIDDGGPWPFPKECPAEFVGDLAQLQSLALDAEALGMVPSR